MFDGDPFEVTPATYKAYQKFHGGIRCALCGTFLKVGDRARFIMTNTNEPDTKGISGNPIICLQEGSNRAEILQELQDLRAGWEEAKAKFWWFIEKEVGDANAKGYQQAENDQRNEHSSDIY
jgi:hypothetical protein